MQEWKMRTREIAYLLNPAFCGRILYTTIRAYNEKSHRAFPFPLIYLVLPLGQFTRNYTQTTKRGLLTTNKG